MIVSPHAESFKGSVDDVHLNLGEQSFTLNEALKDLERTAACEESLKNFKIHQNPRIS